MEPREEARARRWWLAARSEAVSRAGAAVAPATLLRCGTGALGGSGSGGSGWRRSYGLEADGVLASHGGGMGGVAA